MSIPLKLVTYPEDFNEKWCLMHPCCEKELQDIVARSGNYGKLRANFKTRMDYLKQHWENAVLHKSWFEKLSHEKDLYSLHIANVNNLRILYVLHGKQAWLLCAFAEKDHMKQKSYHKYIPIAKSRLEEILEEEDNV